MAKIGRKELRKMIIESLTGTENDPTMRDFNRFIDKTSEMCNDYKERRRRMSVEDRLAALEARMDAMEGTGESLTESRADHVAGIRSNIDRLRAELSRLESEMDDINKQARDAEALTGSPYDAMDIQSRYGDAKRGEIYPVEDKLDFLQSQLDAFEEAGDGPVSLPRRD